MLILCTGVRCANNGDAQSSIDASACVLVNRTFPIICWQAWQFGEGFGLSWAKVLASRVVHNISRLLSERSKNFVTFSPLVASAE
jgi:hypothetical protein